MVCSPAPVDPFAPGGAFWGFVAAGGVFRSLALVRPDADVAPLEAPAEAFARFFDGELFAGDLPAALPVDLSLDRPATARVFVEPDFALAFAGDGVAPKPNICVQEPPSFMP